jgi:signal peptidase I
MASDHDVIERLRARLPEDGLPVPVHDIVAEARRRRRTRRALLVAAILAVGATVVAGPATERDATVAGFTVFEASGRHVIGLHLPSGSMEPTLRVGDVVAIDVGAYPDGRTPERGDIVAFVIGTPDEGCGGIFVKRVAGVAGDVVEQVGGLIEVNGERLEGPQRDRRHDALGPWTVDPGHLFVVGDDLDDSNDSRTGLGQVPVDAVMGRVDRSLDLDRADIPAPPACTASVQEAQ